MSAPEKMIPQEKGVTLLLVTCDWNRGGSHRSCAVWSRSQLSVHTHTAPAQLTDDDDVYLLLLREIF